MAERTTQSWTTAPHFFVTREVDASGMVALREKLAPEIEKSHGVKVTHTDTMVALVARVLAKHPRINSSFTPEGIRLHGDVNIGIAMAVEDGVVTAVIPKANTTGLAQIAVQRRDLTERARANRLRPADISGATFTISNLGMYQVDSFTAIIVPPQAAHSRCRRDHRPRRARRWQHRHPADDLGHAVVRPSRRGRRARRGLPQRPRGSYSRA